MKKLLLLFAGTLLLAQTTRVYYLTPAESAEGKRLAEAQEQAQSDYLAAQTNYELWKDSIAKKHLKAGDVPEFSEGFKYVIAPVLPLVPPGGMSCVAMPGYWTNCNYIGGDK